MDQVTTLLAVTFGVFLALGLTTTDKRTDYGNKNQMAQPDLDKVGRADPPAGPFDPDIEDLIDEINQLRAENAILSGAYQFVMLEKDGRRHMVRFSLN